MPDFWLVRTCYGCGGTLGRSPLSSQEAAAYARDLREFALGLGRIEHQHKRVVMYDGLCSECALEITTVVPQEEE